MKMRYRGMLLRFSYGLALAILSRHQSLATPTFASGVSAGTVSISSLIECSGIVASRNNASVLWAHNDSGDSARLFALDTQGRRLGTYNLTGATHTDYEDIAIGPGPLTNVSYLYVGDIGDNAEARSTIRVYQIPEPAVYSRQHTNPATFGVKGVRGITLHYPDGSHNAESLFVDPWSGDLFIVTKEAVTSRIYSTTQAALNSGTNVALALVRNITFDTPSSADISPTGREIIIRQEEFARLWTRSNGQSINSALAGTPVNIPVIGSPTEPNGEAVAFDANGNGYYTLSEIPAGQTYDQPLYYFGRTSADGVRLPQTVVPAGATWKYLDNGTDQGTTWRLPNFDDSSWSSGIAQFGYGNSDEKTVVGYGGNPNNKFVTTYFRKQFMVDNAPCIESLTLKLIVDDGASIYLNGTNILHYQLVTNAAYNSLATATQATDVEDTWFSFPISPTALRLGTNTLAVEIHQAAINSSDISFDLQLVAMESSLPRFTSCQFNTNDIVLRFCGPSTTNITIQASTDLETWTNVGSAILSNGLGGLNDAQMTNHNQRFYRAIR